MSAGKIARVFQNIIYQFHQIPHVHIIAIALALCLHAETCHYCAIIVAHVPELHRMGRIGAYLRAQCFQKSAGTGQGPESKASTDSVAKLTRIPLQVIGTRASSATTAAWPGSLNHRFGKGGTSGNFFSSFLSLSRITSIPFSSCSSVPANSLAGSLSCSISGSTP